jgi:hypothetical protein
MLKLSRFFALSYGMIGALCLLFAPTSEAASVTGGNFSGRLKYDCGFNTCALDSVFLQNFSIETPFGNIVDFEGFRTEPVNIHSVTGLSPEGWATLDTKIDFSLRLLGRVRTQDNHILTLNNSLLRLQAEVDSGTVVDEQTQAGTASILGGFIEEGTFQEEPILPTSQESGQLVFKNTVTGRWFDPPTAYGFEYSMLSNSVFTQILGFPTGFSNLFTITVGNRVLGQFQPGDTVDFVALLGQGVSSFSLTGINPLADPENPTAFPLQLTFNTNTADFQMTALSPNQPESVPEPSTVLGSLLCIALGATAKRKLQQ